MRTNRKLAAGLLSLGLVFGPMLSATVRADDPPKDPPKEAPARGCAEACSSGFTRMCSALT